MMPNFQYNKHSLHCVLGSVSNNSNSSALPTSWIIFLDFSLSGLQALFCCSSRWRDCQWGWFSIFFTSSRTRSSSACFTTECGNPGILKSMSTSFSIVCSWSDSSQFTTGCTVLSWFVSSSTLKLVLSWEKRVWCAPSWGQKQVSPFYRDLFRLRKLGSDLHERNEDELLAQSRQQLGADRQTDRRIDSNDVQCNEEVATT